MSAEADLAKLVVPSRRDASMSDSPDEPNQRPRFVAGAVCPSCGAQDRTVIDTQRDERRCIACEYIEGRPISGAPEAPATRVTRATARRVETAPEAVRILMPNTKKK